MSRLWNQQSALDAHKKAHQRPKNVLRPAPGPEPSSPATAGRCPLASSVKYTTPSGSLCKAFGRPASRCCLQSTELGVPCETDQWRPGPTAEMLNQAHLKHAASALWQVGKIGSWESRSARPICGLLSECTAVHWALWGQAVCSWAIHRQMSLGSSLHLADRVVWQHVAGCADAHHVRPHFGELKLPQQSIGAQAPQPAAHRTTEV